MKKITDFDKNFKVDEKVFREGLKFYDAEQSPFEIYGIFKENGKFRRMPESVAKTVSDTVFALHTTPAGGRLRFKTDSPYVALHIETEGFEIGTQTTLTSTAGFDMYIKQNGVEEYSGTFLPPTFDIKDNYESVIDIGEKEFREITINFPRLYTIKSLYVGLNENSSIENPTPYKNQKPIVYYGSSITMGACASRPGTAYQNMICRKYDCDYINLGFAGGAKGEVEIAEYIKNLDMSIFVYDYDHNAPDTEHLLNTHEKMFKIIRDAQPELPIIILSRPKFFLTQEEVMRLGIIQKTYDNAKSHGDKNVYFIDGKTLMQLCKNDGLVDNCHPTDLGFASIAKALGDVIEKLNILKF